MERQPGAEIVRVKTRVRHRRRQRQRRSRRRRCRGGGLCRNRWNKSLPDAQGGLDRAQMRPFAGIEKRRRQDRFLAPLLFGLLARPFVRQARTQARHRGGRGEITAKLVERGQGQVGGIDCVGLIKPCLSSHCVGYTLEAEFGVARNGRAEPDYKGWEIKAETVRAFNTAPTGKAITLMTPEPTVGFYKNEGVEAFVRKFGYADKLGRADRINFGGVHRANETHAGTKLTLRLNGFDVKKLQITNPEGSLSLETSDGVVAAEWSFASLITLWNRKHAQAAYVPALAREHPNLQYSYGSLVRLAVGTDIGKLLGAISSGYVYYDPAVKLENASTMSPTSKRRSQFRVGSRNLFNLYNKVQVVDVLAG